MKKHVSYPDEFIISKIFLLRGLKVMMDRDLASLYGVPTKHLKRQVRRNIDRFPRDFMFQMSAAQFKKWRSQFGASNDADKMGLRYVPYCFTEEGVAMLSSVLNSELAIKVNIRIIRIFTKMRKMVSVHQDILLKLEQLDHTSKTHESEIQLIFKTLKQLLNPPIPARKSIGFKT